MKKVIIPGIIPIALLISSLLYSLTQKLPLYPGKEKEIIVTTEKDLTYTNKNWRPIGNSEIYKVNSSYPVEVDFKLKKSQASPFVKIAFPLNTQIPLKEYTNMTVVLEGKHLESFVLTFHSPGEKRERVDLTGDTFYSYYFKEQEKTYYKGRKRYSFDLSKFAIPVWWYVSYNTSPHQIPPSTWTKLFQVDITTGSAPLLDTNDSLKIHSITLEKRAPLLTYCGLSSSLFYGVYLAFLKKKKKNISLSYRQIELESRSSNDIEKITSMIQASFKDPEFSLEQLSLELGISEDKIGSIIKSHYNRSFRQYLNDLRLEEARRMLLETDHSILDIAFKAGYNTISHFNRVFKQYESVSPREFRKIKKNSHPESLEK